jgi:RimJ/RimL family protein N-acetyltransferase
MIGRPPARAPLAILAMNPPPIVTDRLVLRPWQAADLAPFAALNADPEVMRFFPSTLTRAESDALAARIIEGFARRGFGFWAVDVPGCTSFAGFVGLSVPSFEAPFTPCVEIGWRLARPWWGHGYATEAARASLEYGFGVLRLKEVVAFAVPDNVASLRVMDRIGMQRDAAGDFEHPRLPSGHPLRPHVLYRIGRPSVAARPVRGGEA